MATKSNTDIVFEKLGFKPRKLRREEFSKEQPHSPEEAHDRVAYYTLESRIDAILQPYSLRTNDSIFFLNINELKLAVDDVWDKNRVEIHKKIHRLLDHSLTGYDIYLQLDDSTYIVMTDEKLSYAQLKMLVLGEDISKAVMEKDGPSLVTVKDAKISWPNDVKLQETPDKNVTIRTLIGEEDQLRDAGKNTNGKGTGSSLYENVKFIYRPLLDVHKKTFFAHQCIPIKPNGDGSFSSSYSIAGPTPSTEAIFELDMLTLDAMSQELKLARELNIKSLLFIPVHFKTLASFRRQKYIARSRELLEEYASKIVYELVGVPEDTLPNRMFDCMAALKGTSQSIIARFPIGHSSFEPFRLLGLHAVGVDLCDMNISDKQLSALLGLFVKRARKTQLKTYVHGIHTESRFSTSVCVGVDYLDGYALSSAVSHIKEVSPFSSDMLHRD